MIALRRQEEEAVAAQQRALPVGCAWMAIVAALVLAQKLLPPRTLVDLPLALVALGVLIVLAPAPRPGSPHRCERRHRDRPCDRNT